ncbi:MAG TPA: hypothetical protein VMY05_00980 [Acidobacteriota bacterium]|nr:hypothetical protein [Acidobacteriota bacterium]
MRHRILQCGVFLSCLVSLCFLSVSSEAVELTGRVNSSLYGSERSDDTHWRTYVGFNSTATLWHGDQTRALGLHINLRRSDDLAAGEPGASQTYIYNFYLSLRGYPAGSTIYAGRQFVYNTLGSSVVDGLRARLRILKSVSIDLFGGAGVSHETPDKIQSLSGHGAFGSRVEYARSRSFRLGLNWLARTSDGSVSRHRAGIDAWGEIRRTEFYTRVSYDLLDRDMAGVLARATARPDKWYLSAEVHWRKPSVDGNTVFSLIDADAYKGIRAEVTRAVWRDVRVLAQVHRELLDGDDAWRSVFGLRTAHFMMAWHHRDGYGGESDGFQGQVHVNILRNLELYTSAFVSRYLIQPETPDRIDAYSSSAGFLWRPGRAVTVRVEGQYLRNPVDKSDQRIFVQLAKGFRVGPARSEASK